MGGIWCWIEVMQVIDHWKLNVFGVVQFSNILGPAKYFGCSNANKEFQLFFSSRHTHTHTHEHEHTTQIWLAAFRLNSNEKFYFHFTSNIHQLTNQKKRCIHFRDQMDASFFNGICKINYLLIGILKFCQSNLPN